MTNIHQTCMLTDLPIVVISLFYS